MTKNFEELIETACKVQVYFGVCSFEVNHFDDGSYIDFKVNRIVDVPALQKITGDLEIKFFCDNGWLIVRLFEQECF